VNGLGAWERDGEAVDQARLALQKPGRMTRRQNREEVVVGYIVHLQLRQTHSQSVWTAFGGGGADSLMAELVLRPPLAPFYPISFYNVLGGRGSA